MGKKVNKRDLSEIVGVSERSLTEWQREGLPIEYDGDRGEANLYDTEAVIAWMVKREVSKVQAESPKDRLSRLQADMLELQLAEQMNKLAPVEAFEQEWINAILTLRKSTFNELPRLAQILEAAPGYAAKLDILTESFTDIYTKLSSADVDPGEGEHSPGEGIEEEGAFLPGAAAQA